MIRLLFALSLVVAVAGCSAEIDTKLGTEGETCFVDDDCSIEFLCNGGVCSDGSNNNGSGNNGNNGSGNNGIGNSTCADVCNHILGCIDDDFEDCVPECRADTGSWTDRDRQDAFQCILALSCGELLAGESEACVSDSSTDGGPGNTPGTDTEPDVQPGG